MKKVLKRVFTLVLGMSFTIQCFAICPDYFGGMIWKGNEPNISFRDLATHAAPMLWFSPDEPLLYNETGEIQLPQPFPFEEADKPVVYYKIRKLYSIDLDPYVQNSENLQQDFRLLDLDEVTGLDLDYYYYFERETGLGSHPHDIESMTLQIRVIRTFDCPDYKYAIIVKRVIARAHGIHWYNNMLDVDAQTFFPLSILIEEGKHASATDKNADGIFTPGYDVSKRVNDAWGVRDVITSGRLFSGGFQGWMAKHRRPESMLFPPLPERSPFHNKMHEKFGEHINQGAVYEIRPYPDYPRDDIDKKLNHLMKDKRPHDWPKVTKTSGDGTVNQWIKEEKDYRSLGVAYRWDDSNNFSFAVPLLLFKTVEAPMTGGWLYHKFYLGRSDSLAAIDGSRKILGHQIVHSGSASRWIDTYVGLGYEIWEMQAENGGLESKMFFASEAGIKIRLNITKTPLKFLRHLGTDFWGIRLGWKNVGFRKFRNSGFVLEIGAGVF